MDGERFGTLKTIESGGGYWIYMLNAANLTMDGEVMDKNIPLKEGWNLIGWPSNKTMPISEALASIDGNYNKIFAYNDGWDYLADVDGGQFGTLSTMKPGRGYWVYMSAADTLVVDN